MLIININKRTITGTINMKLYCLIILPEILFIKLDIRGLSITSSVCVLFSLLFSIFKSRKLNKIDGTDAFSGIS